MFLKKWKKHLLSSALVVISGTNSLNSKAILKLSEEAVDRSPFSFFSDEEYSKIKNYDRLFDLIDKFSKYDGRVKKIKEKNNPSKVTFNFPVYRDNNIIFIKTLRRDLKILLQIVFM